MNHFKTASLLVMLAMVTLAAADPQPEPDVGTKN